MADQYQTTTQSYDDSELAKVLGGKRIYMDNPGTLLTQDIYYQRANCSMDSVEVNYNVGQYTQSLSSLFMGAQSTIILANHSLVSSVFLYMELPNLYPGQALCRGWGYNLIDSITYIFGNSNTANLSLNGQSLIQKTMAACITNGQRDEIWRLAGQEYLQPIMRLNATTQQPERDPNAKLTACVQLLFPWSDVNGTKLPFDSSLLTVPITLTIALKRADSIYSGSVSPYPFPTALLTGSVIFRQGQLTNQGNSLKMALMENPGEMVSYPFVYSVSYVPPDFAGSQVNPVNIVLTGFINADLVGVTFGVIRTNLLQSSGTFPANPCQYDNIRDVVLKYNGLIVWSCPGDSWKRISMHSNPSGQFFSNSLIQYDGATQTYTSIGQDNYFTHIDFSRIRALCFSDHMQNVKRIAANQLQLSFTTESGSDQKYTLFATYHYNAMCSTDSTSTQIYF